MDCAATRARQGSRDSASLGGYHYHGALHQKGAMRSEPHVRPVTLANTLAVAMLHGGPGAEANVLEALLVCVARLMRKRCCRFSPKQQHTWTLLQSTGAERSGLHTWLLCHGHAFKCPEASRSRPTRHEAAGSCAYALTGSPAVVQAPAVAGYIEFAVNRPAAQSLTGAAVMALTHSARPVAVQDSTRAHSAPVTLQPFTKRRSELVAEQNWA